MSPLGGEISAIIAQEGPISVERYMALALSHPVHGYYMTREPFGAAGDFVTAPEISQMFGELLGLWAAEAWALTGAPSPVRLVEIGPGRGTMMKDALRAAKVSQQFYASLDVHLVETSPRLMAEQRGTLAASGLEVAWHAGIADVPDGPAIILANELFDALPVRHYVRTAAGWCERCVGLDANGALAFGVSREPEPTIRNEAREGAVLEISAAGYRLASMLAARLAAQGGAMLVVDYGHTETGIGATLQAMRDHQFVDPLADPGLADLTAHVDFAALARAARAQGLDVQGPVTQGAFLRELGIFERAAALRQRATPQQVLALDAALQRLTQGSEGMGELFKAMALCPRGTPVMPGFAGVA